MKYVITQVDFMLERISIVILHTWLVSSIGARYCSIRSHSKFQPRAGTRRRFALWAGPLLKINYLLFMQIIRQKPRVCLVSSDFKLDVLVGRVVLFAMTDYC